MSKKDVTVEVVKPAKSKTGPKLESIARVVDCPMPAMSKNAEASKLVGFDLENALQKSKANEAVAIDELENDFVNTKFKYLSKDLKNKIRNLNHDDYHARQLADMDSLYNKSFKAYKIWIEDKIREIVKTRIYDIRQLRTRYGFSKELIARISNRDLWRTNAKGLKRCELFLIHMGVDLEEHPYKKAKSNVQNKE